MTEDEILAEIALISTVIQNIAKVGQKYEVGTGQSKRVFENADLDKWINYRKELYRDLSAIQNCGGGVLCGF